MQDYSELMAHPTGTLESIAVRTAVNTLTPPERHGSAPRREYCPGKRTVSLTAGPYRYRVFQVGTADTERSAHPRGHRAPTQSPELIV